MFPREFKNSDSTKLGTDNQSVQSGAGKVSCTRQHYSWSELADTFRGPEVSTVMGSKRY